MASLRNVPGSPVLGNGNNGTSSPGQRKLLKQNHQRTSSWQDRHEIVRPYQRNTLLDVFFSKDFLTTNELAGLKKHKYACVDNSILNRLVMNRVWESILPLLPIWMAPNLITFVGFLANVLTTAYLLYFVPTLEGHAPGHAYLLCGLGVLFYQTMDALDGKQARRTHTGSVLGELFDHGCDAVSCLLLVLGVLASCQHGPTLSSFFLALLYLLAYYTAHWLAFVTGSIEFGSIDVTEGQFFAIGAHLGSYFFGPEIWRYPVYSFNSATNNALDKINKNIENITSKISASTSEFVATHLNNINPVNIQSNGNEVLRDKLVLPPSPIALDIIKRSRQNLNGQDVAEITLGNLCAFLAIAVSLFSIARVVYTIIFVNSKPTVANSSVLQPAVPLAYLLLILYLTFTHPASADLFLNHTSIFIITFGLAFAKLSCSLVVAHMAKHDMIYWDVSLTALLINYLSLKYNILPPHVSLYLSLAFVSVRLSIYAKILCEQLKNELKINIFTIPSPP